MPRLVTRITMGPRSGRTLLGMVGLALAAVACGEPFGIVGGSGGAAGGASGGAASSSSVSAGASGGSGGAAPMCQPGVLGECGQGSYCQSEINACRPCADLSRLHFSAPTPVSISPETTGTTAFYPRVAAKDGGLFFARKYKNGTLPVRQIASAVLNAKHDGWTMWSELGDPVNSTADESGPLWLPDGSILQSLVDTGKVDLAQPVLLFDSNRDGLTTYKIFAANPGGAEAAEVGLPTGKRDTDVAAAPAANPPRFYWLSDAGVLQQRLVTGTASESQATPVTIKFENGCTTGNVQSPWVTPDGKHLFFAAAYPDQTGCVAAVTAPMRLFHAHMTDSGAQTSDPAVAVFEGDTTSFDSTPALDPLGCVLLFARFDASTNGHLAFALRD